MRLKIETDDWVADVIMTEEHQSEQYHFTHVECGTVGKTKETALAGVVWVMRHLCEGRQTYVRVAPETNDLRDVARATTIHRGYARFSFLFREGKWKVVCVDPQIVRLPGLGSAEMLIAGRAP